MPVSPVVPLAPVAPAVPVLPVLPVAPVAPAGPGVVDAAGVTTVFSQAVRPNVATSAARSIEYFMMMFLEW